jgi:hypothetical protein
MELRHLRYFVAVAEALNFTKASARLRVAQPALSRQMTDLEDEIGVDLMKRSPRGVTLTAEGKPTATLSSRFNERSLHTCTETSGLAAPVVCASRWLATHARLGSSPAN